MLRSLFAIASVCGAQQLSASELPNKTMGLYLVIADDTTHYPSEKEWEPELPAYMEAANVLYLSFVNPEKMPALPPAMVHVAKNHPEKPVLAALGGALYSEAEYSWPWLKSVEAAENMAERVAHWADLGIDGIDLDIETGAGDDKEAGPNMLAFVAKLQALVPGFLVTQPVYGNPGVDAENYMVNRGFEQNASAVIGSVGIMLYDKATSLNYVDNYVKATSHGPDFAITADVPPQKMIVGADGKVDAASLMKLAEGVRDRNLGGIMVWCASVNDKATGSMAFSFGDDASTRSDPSVWARAVSVMQGAPESLVV